MYDRLILHTISPPVQVLVTMNPCFRRDRMLVSPVFHSKLGKHGRTLLIN